MTLHYNPGDADGKAACNLHGVPPERLTADLDAVDCGNCLSSRAWRQDMSQRIYKGDYERFYGPGGFLDRAGQTTPASATTAPQARAAFQQRVTETIARVAGLGSQGAGSSVMSAATRDAVRTLMTAADALVRLALDEAAAAAGQENSQ